MNIGMLIIATGKYDIFISNFLASAKKFFLTNHNVTYYLFTDSPIKNYSNDVKIIEHKHQKWPFPTLFRYKTFLEKVGDEVLGDIVATIHPGFNGGRGSPEDNPKSKAYIKSDEKLIYFAGAFNGGTKNNYIKMCRVLNQNIDDDLANGIIAIWHDESHMNRYLVDNPPTTILDYGYCYPEDFNGIYPKKVIALNKKHSEIRS